MKNKILFFIIVGLIAIGITSITSCKRKKVEDPTMTGPAAFRISLSGTANPSTLYVPATQPAVSTVITVRALNNDGTPVANRKIIFQEGSYGYFEGYKISDVRTTNSNGVAQITYFIPPAANVKNTTMTNILATLVDDGSLDISAADVDDVIPIKIIPYVEQGVVIHGRVTTPTGEGVGDVTVTLEGADSNINGITITRPSGSYEFYVPAGWYGDITPTHHGYTFTPTAYNFASTNPITVDMMNLDFVAVFDTLPKLAADVTQWTVSSAGGSTSVNVYNSSDDAAIPYTIVTNTPWVHVSKIQGVTPDSFTITVDPNPTTEDRTGTIVLTATDVEGSNVTITVTQKAAGIGADADLETSITEINAPAAASTTTVNVYNPDTDDTIDYAISIEYDASDTDRTWITTSADDGSTNDNFDITVAANTGAARTGYVWVSSMTPGISKQIRITINQAAADYIELSPESWVADAAGGTTILSISNPNGTALTWNAVVSEAWINVSPTTGTVPSELTVTVTANPSSMQRSGFVTITDGNGQQYRFLITQN